MILQAKNFDSSPEEQMFCTLVRNVSEAKIAGRKPQYFVLMVPKKNILKERFITKVIDPSTGVIYECIGVYDNFNICNEECMRQNKGSFNYEDTE